MQFKIFIWSIIIRRSDLNKKDYMREFMRRRRKGGICSRCKEKAEINPRTKRLYAHCRDHRKMENEAALKRYYRKSRSGIAASCVTRNFGDVIRKLSDQ